MLKALLVDNLSILCSGSAFSVHFRHFTVFFRFLSANSALPYLTFQHRVISSTGTPELLTRKYLTDIDHGKG